MVLYTMINMEGAAMKEICDEWMRRCASVYKKDQLKILTHFWDRSLSDSHHWESYSSLIDNVEK